MRHTRSAAARRRPSAGPDARATSKRKARRAVPAAPLVLIVDDSEDTRDLYAALFADAGFRVAFGVDGEHAVWKVALLKPDVIVMDLAMPFMDGWEATKLLKDHPKLRRIPILVLTGQADQEKLHRARAAGADGVLTKPCPPDTLLATVRTLLTR